MDGSVEEQSCADTELLARLRHLPSFNPVAVRALGVDLNRWDAHQTLTRLIESDPALTADVLRLANSALFAQRATISSVGHAITFLGVARMKATVARAATELLFRDCLAMPGVKRCWQHSLATAEIAHLLAQAARLDANLAYMGGLLHDIGRLALLRCHPSLYLPMWRREYATPQDLRAGERDLFGLDHCEVAALLMRTWALPASLAEAARQHHEPVAAAAGGLVCLTGHACRIAAASGYATVAYAEAALLPDLLWQLPAPVAARVPKNAEQFGALVLQRLRWLESTV